MPITLQYIQQNLNFYFHFIILSRISETGVLIISILIFVFFLALLLCLVIDPAFCGVVFFRLIHVWGVEDAGATRSVMGIAACVALCGNHTRQLK